MPILNDGNNYIPEGIDIIYVGTDKIYEKTKKLNWGTIKNIVNNYTGNFNYALERFKLYLNTYPRFRNT